VTRLADKATAGRYGTLLEAACCGAAVCVLILVALHTTRFPQPVALILFSTLLVLAENSAADLPTTKVSPSFMLVMAAISTFHHSTALGAVLVAMWGGLSIANLRQRRFGVVIYNCSQYVLAAAAAAAVYATVKGMPNVAIGVPVLAAAATFAVVNCSLVFGFTVLLRGAEPAEVLADMAPALPNYFAFGILGTFVGLLYAQLGPLVLILLITPLAIARAVFSSYLELREAHEATIKVLLRAIEAKDPYTAGHTYRVARFSQYIGEELGFSPARMEKLRNAALVHDVGKLAVPKSLLTKPGKLNDEEFRQVQRHVSVCVDILAKVDFLRPMTAAAAGHHARYDGQGYGGTGDVPLEGSIVAVADAFDAMTSTRAYRRALEQEVAFDDLRAKAGSQLHPECVEALITALERRHEHYGAGHEIDLVSYETVPPVTGTGSAGLGDLLKLPSPATG
jgi:hypothetical protein